MTALAPPDLDRPASRLPPRRRPARSGGLTSVSGLGLGVALTWFSLLVLIPLAAVVATSAAGGWSAFLTVLQNDMTASAVRLTVGSAAIVTVLNVVMGTIIAWVLVRDRFWGKSLLNLVIDLPFALPTVVAGLVLLSLYGPQSPLGINVSNTRIAVLMALAFVTVPFVVRTVQPVLEELEADVEEASACLGATRLTTFRRVILPSLVPAIFAGAALAFARAIAEYGSLVLLSGSLPFETQVASVRVLAYLEGGDRAGAASLATLLLVVALVVIVVLDVIQRRVARRG